jgi:hypothetical protein
MSVRIVNYRQGFATNSSSTHYVLVGVENPPPCDSRLSVDSARRHLGEGAVDQFDGPLSAIVDLLSASCGPYEFGWNPSIISSRDAKRRYLATTAYESVPHAMRDTLGVEVARFVDPDFDDEWAYVDHQSCMDMPWTWDGSSLDLVFLGAMRDFFDRQDVVILTGNDNGESPLDYVDGAEWRGLWVDANSNRPASQRPVARREANDIWTIFNRSTGNRLTVALGDSETPERYSAPMLMDVKITDRCPFGCAHCYQGSTPAGHHAKLGDVRRLANEAADMRVFEVAIGGGEPTKHPYFVGILKLFRARGIVPNFTTFATDWLRDRRKRDRILSHCGAFAYSLDTRRAEEDLREFRSLLRREDRSKATIHLVAGTLPPAEIVRLVRLAEELGIAGVTLLGYKATGRAPEVPPHPYADGSWVAELIATPRWKLPDRLGIDTLLAAQMESVLQKFGQPRWLYSTREGDASMYVDLVSSQAGPSSYHPDRMIKHVNLCDSWDAIQVVDNADGRTRR